MYLASSAAQEHVGDLVEWAFTILPQNAAANVGAQLSRAQVRTATDVRHGPTEGLMIDCLPMYGDPMWYQAVRDWNKSSSGIEDKLGKALSNLWQRRSHPGLDLDSLIHTTAMECCTHNCGPRGKLKHFKVLEPLVSAAGCVVLSDWCTCPSRRLLCTDLLASVSL